MSDIWKQVVESEQSTQQTAPTRSVWGAVVDAAKPQEPTEPDEQTKMLNAARERQAGEGQSTLEWIARKGALGGSIGNWAREKQYGKAVEAFNAGQGTPELADKIARYERLKQIDAENSKTTLGAVKEGVGHAVLGILPEFVAGGAAVKAGGKALGLISRTAPAAAPTLLGSTTLASQGARVAQAVAATPLVPSLYLEKGAQNQNANPKESVFQSYAPAVMEAAIQNAVLGSVQGSFTGAPITRLGRIGAKTITGMGEAAAGDVGMTQIDRLAKDVTGYSLGIDTKNGMLGKLRRGDPDTRKELIVQAATFAVFSALHSGPADHADALERAKPIVKDVLAVADAIPKDSPPEVAKAAVDAYIKARMADISKPDEMMRAGDEGPVPAEKDTVSTPAAPVSGFPTGMQRPATGQGFQPRIIPPTQMPGEGQIARPGANTGLISAPEGPQAVGTPLPGRVARDASLLRAHEAVKGGKPAVYIDMDVDNMSGLAAHVGDKAAHQHVAEMVDIVRQELAGTGAHVEVFRHAGDVKGDEHSAVVVGADKTTVDAAMARAAARIKVHNAAKGLQDIAHGKPEKAGIKGTGLSTGAEPMVAKAKIADIVQGAEQRTETTKSRLRPAQKDTVSTPKSMSMMERLKAGSRPVVTPTPARIGEKSPIDRVIPGETKIGLESARKQAANIAAEAEQSAAEKSAAERLGSLKTPDNIKPEEKAALEAVIEGQSYRDAGKEQGVSQTTISNRANAAIKKYAQANPEASEGVKGLQQVIDDAAASEKAAQDAQVETTRAEPDVQLSAKQRREQADMAHEERFSNAIERELQYAADRDIPPADHLDEVMPGWNSVDTKAAYETYITNRKQLLKEKKDAKAGRQTDRTGSADANQARSKGAGADKGQSAEAHADPERAAEDAVIDDHFGYGDTPGSPGPLTAPPSSLPPWMQKAVASVKAQLQSLSDHWNSLAGQVAPKIARVSAAAANAIQWYLAVPGSIAVWKPQVMANVFGPITGKEHLKGVEWDTLSPKEQATQKKAVGRIYLEVAGEERYRHLHIAHDQEGDRLSTEAKSLLAKAAAESDAKKKAALEADAKKQADKADEHYDESAKFGQLTFIGGKNSRLTSEHMFDEIRNAPEYKAFKERWEKHFGSQMRHFFAMAHGQDSPNFSQLPGFTVSFLANEKPTAGATVPGPKPLSNARVRSLGARRQFTGEAEHGYNMDPEAVMDHMMQDRIPAARKAEVVRALRQANLGVWVKEGEQPPPALEDGRTWHYMHDVMPKSAYKLQQRPEMIRDPESDTGEKVGNDRFYLHPDAVPETLKAFGTDRPFKKLPGTTPLTKATLLSFIEMASHGKNLLTMSFKPGMHPYDLIKNAIGAAKYTYGRYGHPETEQKLIDLAQGGRLKPKGLDSGFLWGGKSDPSVWSSKFLDFLDSTIRLTAADAFERVHARKGFKDMYSGKPEERERAKSNFINQAGMYLKGGTHDAVAFLRETGIGPFAVAATNYTIQGLRTLFGSSGIKAPNQTEAVKLRMEMYARVGAIFAVAAISNLLAWNRADGDENTPIGGLKVGVDEKGKSQYFDLGAMTGLPRGARALGILALAEGSRADASSGTIAKRAVHDVVGSVLHPAEGPAVAFAHGAITGENTIGMPIAKKAGYGESQELLNLQGALANSNPVYAALSGRDRPRATEEPTTLETASKLVGPIGVKHRDTPPGGSIVSELFRAVDELEVSKREAANKMVPFTESRRYQILRAVEPTINRISKRLKQPGLTDEQRIDLKRQQRRLAREALKRADSPPDSSAVDGGTW